MIIECPKCGTKNQTDKTPQPGSVYRCGNCREVITFLKTVDVPSETTSVPAIDRTPDVVKERTSSQGRSAVIPKEGIVPFESGHSRAQWVSRLLAAVVVLDIIAVISDYAEIQLINRVISGEIVTAVEATANDNRQVTIGGIYFILFILTAILFCMWIHRAHRNLSSLGNTNLKYSPRWAVGGFFVPFLNLWRPYQVTTEIWKASDPTIDMNNGIAWQNSSTSSIIPSWWFLFVVSGFLGNILLRISLQAETLSEILTASWVGLIIDAMDIPAAILAILVVRNIDLRQEQKSKLLTTRISV